jgi:hypothetical protein
MHHASVRSARQALNEWIAHHLPILADEAQSAEEADMVIRLGGLARWTRIQLDAIEEQRSQDLIKDQQM